MEPKEAYAHDDRCERVKGKQTWCACQRRAQEARDRRIVAWTKEGLADFTYDSDGSPNGPGDTDHWEDLVWWGFWRQVGGECSEPPDVMFPTEEEAYAFAKVVGVIDDWHVGPCVLTVETRDNFEVPK